MASKPKNKMAISERAKQFMPFSALKGLSEALAAQEHIRVPKVELSEEMAQELDFKLRQLKVGESARITYFKGGDYIEITGIVAMIDPECRFLEIVYTRIAFDDLLDITIC